MSNEQTAHLLPDEREMLERCSSIIPGSWCAMPYREDVPELLRRLAEARRALREAKESGDRLALLVTAACDLIRVNSLYEYTATWDETTCDGYCFLDDAKIALHEWKRDAAAHAAKEGM